MHGVYEISSGYPPKNVRPQDEAVGVATKLHMDPAARIRICISFGEGTEDKEETAHKKESTLMTSI